MIISRQRMHDVAVDAALTNQHLQQILNEIERRARAGEFYLVTGVRDELVERLRGEPYLFEVDVDDINPSEPPVIRW